MIEVRLRHVDSTKAVRLCDWPTTDVVRILSTLNELGLRDASSGYETSAGTLDLEGQIVYDPESSEAYFEVLISDVDEST